MFERAAHESLPVWQQLQARAVEALPAVTASVLILAAGILLGWLAGRVAGRLVRRGRQEWAPGSGPFALPLTGWDRRVTVARTVQLLVVFGSTIVALYPLDPRLASTLTERLLLYVPRLASGIFIVVVGMLLSRYVGRAVLIAAVNHDIRPARLLASAARTALVVLAVAIALEHAAIGQRTVLVAFAILFGGLTLAASIALGLALQEPLRRWLGHEGEARSRAEREEETMHHL